MLRRDNVDIPSNPIKVGEVRKALKSLGRGTLRELAERLDITLPKRDGRHWTESEVNNLISDQWAVRDADSPNEFVFAEGEADRRHFSTKNRYWEN